MDAITKRIINNNIDAIHRTVSKRLRDNPYYQPMGPAPERSTTAPITEVHLAVSEILGDGYKQIENFDYHDDEARIKRIPSRGVRILLRLQRIPGDWLLIMINLLLTLISLFTAIGVVALYSENTLTEYILPLLFSIHAQVWLPVLILVSSIHIFFIAVRYDNFVNSYKYHPVMNDILNKTNIKELEQLCGESIFFRTRSLRGANKTFVHFYGCLKKGNTDTVDIQMFFESI